MYAPTLAALNPPFARRAQLESLLRQAVYDRCDSLFRYELSSGQQVYGYFTVSCEVDEIITCLRCLDAGRPGDYLYKLPDFLKQRCTVDLYALARVTDARSLLAALEGTPYRKLLAPLADVPAGYKLLVYAEPHLEAYRHQALVALAPEPRKGGAGKAPGLRDLIEMECDNAAISNAGRLIRMHAGPQVVRPAGAAGLHGAQARRMAGAVGRPGFRCVPAGAGRHRLWPHAGPPAVHLPQGRPAEMPLRLVPQVGALFTDPALVMMCYLYLIQCEVKNLEHIIEGVHYGMPADQLMNLLIGCEDADTQQGREH